MFSDLKVGILGGGQLGAMIIRSAIDFGLNVSVLDKHPNSPAARYTSSFYCGDTMDYDTVLSFGSSLDMLTIEKESVNTKALYALQKMGVKIFPSPDTIEIIQNKWTQKQFLERNHISVVPCIPVNGKDDLRQNINKLPGCLKKCTMGYDGKGVMIIKGREDIESAFNEPSILEELVDIKSEISVIVSRNEHGDISCYDPVMMVFNKEQFVLDYQVCPADIPEEIANEARDLAISIAAALKLEGILAVEMFLTHDNVLLVNELAPRPHNSGHHTIEACATSQYEQLIRVMLGMPMGDTQLKQKAVMMNILMPKTESKESMNAALREILSLQNVHLHWYGKEQSKAGRKVGHVTIIESEIEKALSKVATIRNIKHN